MNNFNQNNKAIWVVGGIIIVIFFIALFYQGDKSNNQTGLVNNTNETSIPAVQQSTSQEETQKQQAANVALKAKCAEDGAKYINNFEKSLPSVGLWGEPSYHFNQKLNTCLATIYWTHTITTSTTGDLSSSNFSVTTDGIFYAYVFDVYSNQVLLQREANIITLSKGGVLTTLSDTLASSPFFPVPNLDADSFKKQYQILFSE